MSEEQKNDQKRFWNRAWNEPRYFFFWLGLVCLLGLAAGAALNECLTHFNPPIWLQNCFIVSVLVLVLGLGLGVLGFIGAWIPPVRRWLEWVLHRRFFALACVITFFTLLVMEEDWRGWRAWNDFKTEWQTKGEKFDWASFTPSAVPDDQNFAMSPVWIAAAKHEFADRLEKAREWYGNRVDGVEVAQLETFLPLDPSRTNHSPSPSLGNWNTSQLTDLKSWQEYYRHPGKADSAPEFSIAAQPQSPAADVLMALSKYDPVVKQLRVDGERPDSQFPINYGTDPGFFILLPHLAWLKGTGRVLELRTVAELKQGDMGQALTDEQLLLRLVNAIRTEPFLISHLVRVALLQMALQPLWEGLAGHQWSEAQLVEIDRSLNRFDFLADYGLAMRGERTLAISSLDYSRRAGIWYGFDGLDNSARLSSLLMPAAFFYRNELTLARMHQQWTLPLVDLPGRTVSPGLVKQNGIAAEATFQHFSPYTIFARLLFGSFGGSVRKFARAQTDVDLARVAVALERYRLVHGEFPETLDVLATQFLEKIPHDIIGGQSLHYRRTRDGQFVLYSVGWNETDDGGVVVLKKGRSPEVDPNQGDWVWKYPTP